MMQSPTYDRCTYKPPPSPMLPCEYCELAFDSKLSLLGHVAEHRESYINRKRTIKPKISIAKHVLVPQIFSAGRKLQLRYNDLRSQVQSSNDNSIPNENLHMSKRRMCVSNVPVHTENYEHIKFRYDDSQTDRKNITQKNRTCKSAKNPSELPAGPEKSLKPYKTRTNIRNLTGGANENTPQNISKGSLLRTKSSMSTPELDSHEYMTSAQIPSLTSFPVLHVSPHQPAGKNTAKFSTIKYENISPISARHTDSSTNQSTGTTQITKVESMNLLKFSPRDIGQAENFDTNKIRAAYKAKHAIDRKYRCTICTKRFLTQWDLTRHRQTHEEKRTADRPFRCLECGKRFIRGWELTLHQQTHDGLDKGHKCSQCSKSFSLKGNLVRHIRQHLGIKPHICKVCEHRFSQRYEMVKHVRIHHGTGDNHELQRLS